MKPLANMFPIAVLATDICDNFGDTDRKYFGEHLRNLINVYKFLHIFLLKNVSVKAITLSPDGIHDLPGDFVRETKIGLINRQGRIATMRVDKNLRVAVPCTTHSQVEQAICAISDDTAPSTSFSFYNVHDLCGGYVGELRGRSCSLNNIGYFNVDRENGILIVSPDIPKEHNIIFEYISDGISEGLELVPTELTDCLTNGAKSRFCLDKKDNRAADYQNKHETDFKNVKRLYNTQRIDFYTKLFKTID